MLKLYKDSKSKRAGSQQIYQLRAATYKMTQKVNKLKIAVGWGEYFWEVSLWACFVLVLIVRHPLLATFGDRKLG